MVRDDVLSVLENKRGEVVSGGAIAKELGVSRTAVWKAVSSLKDSGFAIESVRNGGYRLLASNDLLTPAGIQMFLQSQTIGKKILVLEQVDSTNTRVKQEFSAEEEGFVLVSHSQTGGRGRMGRAFVSDAGKGIYMTILLKPCLALQRVNFLTLAAAVAVCRAAEDCCGFSPGIKWVNDLYMEEKKLCGILTEASIEGESGAVSYAVVGIGVNVDFCGASLPEDVQRIAGDFASFAKTMPLRNQLCASILSHFEVLYQALLAGNDSAVLHPYRERLFFLGKPITVLEFGRAYEAVALSVNDSGNLLVRRKDGGIETLVSGEISIKLQKS